MTEPKIEVVDEMSEQEKQKTKNELLKLAETQKNNIPKRMKKIEEQREYILREQEWREAENKWIEYKTKYYGKAVDKKVAEFKKQLKQLKADLEGVEEYISKNGGQK